MNYYYDLPLELQNYIEDFLIVKPYDNELLNNEEEIEKKYKSYKSVFDKVLYNKIPDFNTHRIVYDYWDNHKDAYESYNNCLIAEYNDINEKLNNFEENYKNFITYQTLFYRCKAIKERKKITLKLQIINEYKNEAKNKCKKHNLYKTENDSYDVILKKYMTELFINYECSTYEDYNNRHREKTKKENQINKCFDKFKKYSVLNTTYERTDYYTYKITLEEEFINDIKIFKNYIKNTHFKTGKYYKENDYELTIINITNIMLCLRLIFYKNSSIHNQLVSRKIFKNDDEIEYIKLTDKIFIYANELNLSIVV